MPRRLLKLLPPAALMAQLLLASATPAAAATGGTLYVDGKHGNDTNSGTSLAQAFKHVSTAAASLPAGSGAAGWTVKIVGYADYVYRERPIPPGWDRAGTSGSPITFEAYGYNGTSNGYARPIISGADSAPVSAFGAAAGYSKIWKQAWATKPVWYGQLSGSFTTVVLQDTTTWLWEQPSLSTLQARANAGKGGYVWTGGQLYVAPVGGKITGHTFDVITRSAFYFDGSHGVHDVRVLGVEVRNSVSGVAFQDGVDGGVVKHSRLIGNLFMGVSVVGNDKTNDPAVGTDIEDNEGAYNTLQAVKVDYGSVNTTVCGNDIHDNGLQGIKVQGPLKGSSYTGTTSGTLVCDNDLHAQSFNPTGTQYNNASGVTIANSARTTSVQDNRIWGNDVGIHVVQEAPGQAAIQDTVVTRNEVWSNRRFGLNLYDGHNGSGAGRLTSSRNLYWDNGIGVMADHNLANKVVDHDTIWWNRTDGVRVASSLTVTGSLITQNREYGVWVFAGGNASVSYTGLSANTGDNFVGTVSTSNVNTKPPGYLSTATSDPGFLVVGSASFQYTAGAASVPIGARWADGFIDIATSIFKGDIVWLAASGITSGCGGDYFCPSTNVTRGQMAAFLDRALHLPSTSTDYFTDDNASIFQASINRLAASGITSGCTATAFCADATVTREQMAAFLDRAKHLAATSKDYFTDDGASIFQASINRLAASGITSGCTATTFCGKALVTRGQMAAFLHRAFG